MNRCPSCGAVGADSDQFCGNCGARLAPIRPPYPYYPPSWAPPQNHTGVIVAVVVVVLLVLVVLPAILYVLTSGLTTHLPQPRSLGVTVARSSDGSNWILTFTSVPTGLLQNDTLLSLTSSSGSALLNPTTLYAFERGLDGVRYVPYMTGPSLTTCAPGDQILLAFGSGANQYPPGTQVYITANGDVLYVGTLQ